MISVTFEGENWGVLRALMHNTLAFDHPAQPNTAFVMRDPYEPPQAEPDIPLEATRGVLPASEPVKGKKGRGKALPTPAEMLAATEPEPTPVPTLAVDNGAMPSLDVLKSIITRAVRSAQKKEGPLDILNLLPAFKAKTGLEFVMHAKEEHRAALFDLVEAAKLETV